MNIRQRNDLLQLLDHERQTILYPGVIRLADSGVIREVSADGKNCTIVYSNNSEPEIDEVIQREMQRANNHGYDLEWKTYGHDQPSCLPERLEAAGFAADDRESFMILQVSKDTLRRFGSCDCKIIKATDELGLRDYQSVWAEVSGRDVESAVNGYLDYIRRFPLNMSVYVAYIDGEPAGCGRTYFHAESKIAALFGGQTRSKFRNRGVYMQLVASRIREGMTRDVNIISTDALPTSEPILAKRGFEPLTFTQPFIYSGLR